MIALIAVKGDISLPLTHMVLVAGNYSLDGIADVRSQWGDMPVSISAMETGLPSLSLGHMVTPFSFCLVCCVADGVACLRMTANHVLV